MSNPDTMRRLLVAVEASPRSRAMLEQAAALARAIEAELAGLFVEDVNLLRLCGLPGHEIALSSGMARRLEQATMERELRAQAEELRRLLEMVAQAREIAWSFQISRGRRREELLGAARKHDLVLLLHHDRKPVTARYAAPKAPALGRGHLWRQRGRR